jgi:ABC-type iron transport system FetAB permease component
LTTVSSVTLLLPSPCRHDCDFAFALRLALSRLSLPLRISSFLPHLSRRLGLSLHSQLVIAAVRCVVQLSLLGYILGPIFDYGEPWLVAAYATFMVWVSAVEAIGRPARFYKVRAACTTKYFQQCPQSQRCTYMING